MPDETCPVFARLQAEAHAILEQLRQLTSRQLAVFDANILSEFGKLDRELELTVGRKERAIGALRQHAAEHGCRPPFMAER